MAEEGIDRAQRKLEMHGLEHEIERAQADDNRETTEPGGEGHAEQAYFGTSFVQTHADGAGP